MADLRSYLLPKGFWPEVQEERFAPLAELPRLNPDEARSLGLHVRECHNVGPTGWGPRTIEHTMWYALLSNTLTDLEEGIAPIGFGERGSGSTLVSEIYTLGQR